MRLGIGDETGEWRRGDVSALLEKSISFSDNC